MSHHKRYRADKRTRARHAQLWQSITSSMSDILGHAQDPSGYFRDIAASLHNLGLGEFVGASRRGINMEGYIDLRDFFETTCNDIIATCNDWCSEAKTYMQAFHPWQNQTRAAEEGLGATVAGIEGQDITMYLYHTVWYGIRLEGQDPGFSYPSGRTYPIIQPTIDTYGPVLLERLKRILQR